VPQKARKRAKTSEIGVRDRLLDAADRLFYREGVRAVGIDRVLAEADAAKASLYQHFGCKDQLVASYLERRTVDARTSRRTSPTRRRHNARSSFSTGWWSGRSRRTSAVARCSIR
jgi:AcrR family transcriptional regulator